VNRPQIGSAHCDKLTVQQEIHSGTCEVGQTGTDAVGILMTAVVVAFMLSQKMVDTVHKFEIFAIQVMFIIQYLLDAERQLDITQIFIQCTIPNHCFSSYILFSVEWHKQTDCIQIQHPPILQETSIEFKWTNLLSIILRIHINSKHDVKAAWRPCCGPCRLCLHIMFPSTPPSVS